MAQPNEGWGTAPQPPPIAGPPPPTTWQVPWAPPPPPPPPPSIAGPPAPSVWQVPWKPPVASTPNPTPTAQHTGVPQSYANMLGNPSATGAPPMSEMPTDWSFGGVAPPRYAAPTTGWRDAGAGYAPQTQAAPQFAPPVSTGYLPPPAMYGAGSNSQYGTTYGQPKPFTGPLNERQRYSDVLAPHASYTPEERQQINAANGTAQAPFRYPASSGLGMQPTTPGWMDAGASAPGMQSPALTAFKPLLPVPPPAYYGHGGGGGGGAFAANLPDYYVKAFESVFGPMANYYTPERGGVLQAQNDFSSLGSSWNYTAKQPLTQDSVDRLFGAFGGIARGQTARGLTPTMSGLFNYVASMLAAPSQQQQNVSYLQTSEL
jgi:hypothetical protein